MKFSGIQMGLLLWFLFQSCSSGEWSGQAAQSPNVLFILADDLGHGDLGFNGQTKIQTPRLDQLAGQGMVFRQFYAGSTVCGPSRASLMTGKHMGHCSVRGNPGWTTQGNAIDMDPGELTLAEIMHSAGYATGMIGKWGLAENLGATTPLDKGFDYFFGFNQHTPAHYYYPETIWENRDQVVLEGNIRDQKQGVYIQDLFTRKARSFIQTHAGKQPFFLYLAYTIPHYQLTVPAESKIPYQEQGWPLRTLVSDHYRHDSDGHQTYAGMVARMDQQIGELMELLAELGIDKNTLVIFTSDNGHEYDDVRNEFFNSNGALKGKKRDLYEGGIRVPMVMRWPARIKPGSVSDHVAAFWDFMPTFCELTGTEIPEDADGLSFLPALKGQQQPVHDYLYWEFNEGQGPIQAIRMGNWKAIKKWGQPIELYNLQDDKGEQRERSGLYPAIVAQIEPLFESARTEHPDFPLRPLY